MKNIIRILSITSLLVLCVSLNTAYSQPAPDNQSDGNNVGGAPIGGGAAPIGGGLLILVALASGYGVKKFLYQKKDTTM
ncbi:MAG: hypothetical protein FD166_3705 [Bacteroidetes bacterium]|nr:MAG: hypothetical protein FD166_3705 [Bacteroidota bacterium]